MAGGLRLTQTLHRQSILFGDNVALGDTAGGYRLTYGQCAQSVAHLAGGLLEDGLQAGERVAILAGNSARYVELLYAVLWAGGVAVPLNRCWAAPELERALQDCEAAVLLLDRAHDETGRWAASPCSGLRSIIPIETLEGPLAADIGRAGGELAIIVYPDSETGVADAVPYSHEWLAARAVRDPASGPRAVAAQLLATPLFEPAAFMWAFNRLAHGHHLIVDNGFNIDAVANAVAEWAVTDIAATPSMVAKLLRHPGGEFRRLHRLHVQAAALSPAAVMALHQEYPEVRLIQSGEMR